MKKLGFLKLMKLKRILNGQGVVLAYLFGSEVRGEAHLESDIDIAALFDAKVEKDDYLKKEGELIGVFSEIYPNKEINIVNLNISSPLLKQNVILEGEEIYIKDKAKKVLFQILTLRQYEDFLYLSNIYNQSLKRKIQEL